MNTLLELVEGVEIKEDLSPGHEDILTPEALTFLAYLHRRFNAMRKVLLYEREANQALIDQGEFPDFPRETQPIRDSDWQVGPIPEDLQDRKTEITGPVERKMMINAMNSGARVFMADFEDANSPLWNNCLDGQANLKDAVRGTIEFTNPAGRHYKLGPKVATLIVRPRGWHLEEKHLLVDGQPISASLFDFGLYLFHNARALLDRGSGPYFYLPKLENRHEAGLWNEVFVAAQDKLGIPQGTIKATVLIETILAAFQMEEIIYELREHMAGLNAGRWDYIFSFIKKFSNHSQFILPDRGQVTMDVPFMDAYAQTLVKVCHKRGAHAIGGMSAFIPTRDEVTNRLAFEKVQADKRREASQGYDGTWVAHPGLVGVALEEFNKVLGDRPHQKEEMREDVNFEPKDFLNPKIEGGRITERGVRQNINVGILYIESWLSGVGAAALYNLMEDAATAEISRAQLWQWLNNDDVTLDDGQEMNLELFEDLLQQELGKIKTLLGPERVASGNLEKASALFVELVKARCFIPFLTIPAYRLMK